MKVQRKKNVTKYVIIDINNDDNFTEIKKLLLDGWKIISIVPVLGYCTKFDMPVTITKSMHYVLQKTIYYREEVSEDKDANPFINVPSTMS